MRAALGCACVRACASAEKERLLCASPFRVALGSIQMERVLTNSPAPPRLCCCSLRGWLPRTRHGGEAEKRTQLVERSHRPLCIRALAFSGVALPQTAFGPEPPVQRARQPWAVKVGV